MCTEDLITLVSYAHMNHLSSRKEWNWVKEYALSHEEIQEIVKVFRDSSKLDARVKFRVEVPNGLQHAMYLDKVNNNHLWKEAMECELKQINNYETYRALNAGECLPAEYTCVPYHFIWDVKFDLRHKCRLVAGGNWMDPPKEDVYSGIVSMDTIRMSFQLAQLNGLHVCVADIGNAFLYGKTTEKVYIRAGPEFSELQGQPLIINKGLYGL